MPQEISSWAALEEVSFGSLPAEEANTGAWELGPTVLWPGHSEQRLPLTPLTPKVPTCKLQDEFENWSLRESRPVRTDSQFHPVSISSSKHHGE